LLAAVGVAQLAKCDDFLRSRLEIATAYKARLAQIDELELPPEPDHDDEHAWHLFILRIRPELLEINRGAFIDHLKREVIGTSVHFIPLHMHPFYQTRYRYRSGNCPNAEDAYSRCVSLPIYPGMSQSEVNRVIKSVEKVVCTNRKRLLAP